VIRIALPEDVVAQLDEVFRTTGDARLRHRVQIVRMAHRGRRHPDIAADTGMLPRSVQRWLNAYLAGGLDALRPRRAKGAAPRPTDDLAPLVRQWVIDGPAECGLDRANWTYAELADHLFRAKGVWPYRPTYRYLRGDPAKQAKAREDIADLNKGAAAGSLVVLGQDEARFPRVPTLAALGVKGHRPVGGTWDCKQLVCVFAVVNLATATLPGC